MNLTDYYQTNLKSIYARVKNLGGIIDTVFMPENFQIPSLEVKPVPTQTADKSVILNRAVYLWALESIEQLQRVVDWLVDTFNGYNLVDLTTGETTESLKLWLPRSLKIDDNYLKLLGKNFSDVNKLLDELEKYAKPYVKGVN